MKFLDASIGGSIVALATPFRAGAVDEEAYARLIRYQLDNGTSALVPVGTTGEAATLSPAERLRCVGLAVQLAKGKVPVIAGAGSFNTQETLEAVGKVRDAGADGALVVTPYYNKPTQAGLVAHFKAIAQGHPGFPLVVYNVPSRTGVDLLPGTLAQLADLKEVVAIKEATGNMARAIDLLEQVGDRVALLSGDDFTLLPFIACGGKGVISVSANVAPRMLAELVQTAREGKLTHARQLQLQLNPLHHLLFAESNPIPLKWALHCLKLCGPDLRLPLTPLSPEMALRLEAELGRLGLVS
jgi:4-hydroxy-tetrahydrodipicolinate synthase